MGLISFFSLSIFSLKLKENISCKLEISYQIEKKGIFYGLHCISGVYKCGFVGNTGVNTKMDDKL